MHYFVKSKEKGEFIVSAGNSLTAKNYIVNRLLIPMDNVYFLHSIKTEIAKELIISERMILYKARNYRAKYVLEEMVK